MNNRKKSAAHTVMNSLRRKIAETLDIPQEGLGGSSHVVLRGRSDLSAEGCRSVLAYSTECVELRITEGILRIVGEKLQIRSLIDDLVTVSGHISAVYIEEEGEYTHD